MNSFSTFIRYYILIGLSLLIPFASTLHKGTDNDISKKVPIASSTPSTKTIIKSASTEHTDIEYEVANIEVKTYLFDAEQSDNNILLKKAGFWTTLHSIESKQGKLLYRPSNKNKNCDTTSAPCGHHQLSLQALKDISCLTKQCKRDRENFQKSLAMSKQLQTINDKRLKKAGYSNLPNYQKYLIHQQGASGLKTIIASSKGKKLLSKNIKKNMAGNSPYSYKTLRRMGSKLAAKKFLQHWEKKWQKEEVFISDTQDKPEVIATIQSERTKTSTKRVPKTSIIQEDHTIKILQFNDYELQIALNIKI